MSWQNLRSVSSLCGGIWVCGIAFLGMRLIQGICHKAVRISPHAVRTLESLHSDTCTFRAVDIWIYKPCSQTPASFGLAAPTGRSLEHTHTILLSLRHDSRCFSSYATLCSEQVRPHTHHLLRNACVLPLQERITIMSQLLDWAQSDALLQQQDVPLSEPRQLPSAPPLPAASAPPYA